MFHHTEIQLRYYYLYQITNIINNKIYVGVHSTNNLDDGYMGSGVYIERAINFYGIENFRKNILRYFKCEEAMYAAEKLVVNPEFIKENTNYNIAEGGHGGHTGNYDSLERSKKISDKSLNKVMVKDKNGNILKTDITDPRYITKELIGHTSGKTSFKDKNGNIIFTDINDPRINSGELVGVTKGRAMMKDVAGNYIQVSIDDPRIKSGELVGVSYGSTQTAESNKKRGDAQRGTKKPKPIASCISCRKTTIFANILRWHKNCVEI